MQTDYTVSWTTALCLEENQRLWLLTPQEAGAFRYDLCWICWVFFGKQKIIFILEIYVL